MSWRAARAIGIAIRYMALDDLLSGKVKPEAVRGHEYEGKCHHDQGKAKTEVP